MAPVPVAETGMVITLPVWQTSRSISADVVHYLEKVWVEVAHHRQGHCLQHPGMDRAGAGPQEQTGTGLEFREV